MWEYRNRYTSAVYGLFELITELGWKYGYEAVLVCMVAVCGGLWLGFKRSGWL
jgi:magnesium transporter